MKHITNVGSKQPAHAMHGNHPHEAHYLRLDCAKAKTRLGWRPRWNLEQALTTTTGWYRAYAAHEDLRAVMLAQISGYENC